MRVAPGYDLKVQRARQLAHDLTKAVREYLDRSPFELTQQDEAVTGDLVWRMSVREHPPAQLGLMLGDAIHNLRSALDHLVWELVLSAGSTPSSRTAFPIADDESTYRRISPSYLAGAAPAAIVEVDDMRPWRGGDDQLWRLHRLDIIDKHRLLVPVGAANKGIALNPVLKGLGGFGSADHPEQLPSFRVSDGDSQYPLNDGAEVFRVRKAAREADTSLFESTYQVVFEVAFGEGYVVSGEPLVPTVAAMVDRVDGIITVMRRFL